MRKRTIALLIGALAVSATATIAAQSTLRRVTALRPESRVWFDGTSTLRGFTCAATRLDATVTTDSAAIKAAPDLLVRAAELVIPVSTLDCKNGRMNDHMRKALKATHHPTITWRMSSYRVVNDSVVIAGQLSIAGKENPIELRAAGTTADGVVRVKGSKQVRMTDFGVTPPTLMLGTLKVHDPVTVKFDVALDP